MTPRTYQWFGSWGTKEYITQPIDKAPKHRALMQYARKNPCWWKGCTNRTITRIDKPARNPVGDVFALVPSKPKKPGAKKPVAIAKVKPKVTPKAPVVKAIAKVTPKVVNKAAKVAAKTATSVAKNNVNNKINTAKTAATIATAAAKPIWETSTPTNNSVKTNSNKAVQKQTPTAITVASAKTKHDAVVHRVKGRGRFWTNEAALHLRNVVDGKINGSRDLSGVWQTHWDNQFLHVRVDALDDKFMRDSSAPWSDDSIEIFVESNLFVSTQQGITSIFIG